MRIIKWFKNLFRTKDKLEDYDVQISEWIDENGFTRKKYVVDLSGKSFSTKRKTVDNLLDSGENNFVL